MNFGPFFKDQLQPISQTKRLRKRTRGNSYIGQAVASQLDLHWRIVPIVIIFATMLLLLAGRLWQLQIIQGEEGLAAANNNSYALEVLPAPRGLIYDRQGTVLARNEPSFKVSVTYAQLPTEAPEQQKVKAKLASLTSMKLREIEDAFALAAKSPFIPVPIKKHIDRDTEIAILTKSSELPGITVQQDLLRNYPLGESLSHVLGYTGDIDQASLKKNEAGGEAYYPGEEEGKSGIEQVYEKYLHGVIGKKFTQRNSQGELQISQNEISPESGNNLHLAIDGELQLYTYQALMRAVEKYKTKGAAAVFQNPKTGEVLSLVSAPGYNNNLFTKGISNQAYQGLLTNPLRPLFNRVTAGVYPPGSTVKPLVAAAAVEEGVIKPDTKVYSPNLISLAGSTYADWTYWVGRAGPGDINAVQAISQSTDTFFYKVGGGFEQQRGLGVNKLYAYYTRAGLGSRTGIDLPGEMRGVVPNPEWKAEQFPDEPDWYVGNTYQLAIGQSYLLSTPLQINVMTSAIANDGLVMKPQIVDRITGKNNRLVQQFTPQKLLDKAIASKQSLRVGQEGMRHSVTDGIIYPLRNNPLNVAAKTGTAEFGNREVPDQYGTHSWITGYAPYNNPEISFTILLDSGGSSTNAAEIANEILDWYQQHKAAK